VAQRWSEAFRGIAFERKGLSTLYFADSFNTAAQKLEYYRVILLFLLLEDLFRLHNFTDTKEKAPTFLWLNKNHSSENILGWVRKENICKNQRKSLGATEKFAAYVRQKLEPNNKNTQNIPVRA